MESKPFVQDFSSITERIALNHEQRSYTYADLLAAIGQQSEELRKAGVLSGHVVFLQGDYSLKGIALFFALYSNGNIIAMNSMSNPREMEERLASCRAHFLADPERSLLEARMAADAPAQELVSSLVSRNRAGLILFSSGSTGKPKAMLHDLDTLIASYAGRRRRLRLNILLFLLFDHIGGINTLLNVLAGGGTATVANQKTPEAVAELIARHRVVVLPTSPTFLNMLLVSGALERYDCSSLRMITYGTEPMPESLLQRLHQALPKVTLLQTFGTSETGIVGTSSRASNSLLLKFDDPSIRHKIVNGELWLHSDKRILGYLNHASDSFTADGWFKTGDLVEEADGGYIRIKGRLKEVINVGGQKVVPSEVESVLLSSPAVRDCKVYGEANPLMGQIVVADVVVQERPGSDVGAIVKDIRLFARANMDPYKVPVRISAVHEIPYSPRFKKVVR